jgi:aryl-phospho-beta-D-glucosidase BglC (GH1 family)
MKWSWLLSMLPFAMGSQIRCISFFGLETPQKDFMCSWEKPIEYYLKEVADLGFNSIRLPFSIQYINEGDLSKMDHFIQECYKNNLNVVLDCHRVESTWQGPTPFYSGLTQQQFNDMWLGVLDRYINFPNVVGGNVYNEYQSEDPIYMMDYSRKLIQAVEDKFGDRFIHFVTGTLWSNELHDTSLEDMPCKDRIFYSVHKYPFTSATFEKDWDYSMPEALREKIVIGDEDYKLQGFNILSHRVIKSF